MNADRHASGIILFSLLSEDDEHGDRAALSIVRRLTQRCTTYLVEDRITQDSTEPVDTDVTTQRRIQRLQTFAEQLGVTLEVEVANTGLWLERAKEAIENEILMLHQPRSALDRQTRAFRQLERAVSALPNNVIYAPTGVLSNSRTVIAFSRKQDESSARLATQFAGNQGHIETFDYHRLQEIKQPQSPLRLKLQSQLPAMILIEGEDDEGSGSTYSRLAETVGAPVLVISRR